MFNRGGDYPGFVPVEDAVDPDSLEYGIIAFGGAAVDDNIVIVGRSDTAVCAVHRDMHLRMCISSELMEGVGIPILLKPEGLHGLPDPGIDKSGGVVVQINLIHV
jgi:hypothetical protein